MEIREEIRAQKEKTGYQGLIIFHLSCTHKWLKMFKIGINDGRYLSCSACVAPNLLIKTPSKLACSQKRKRKQESKKSQKPYESTGRCEAKVNEHRYKSEHDAPIAKTNM